MAREESDREDLLREATALVPRMEIASRAFPEPITVGFRRGTRAASLYFGQDPVFHFTSVGALRRGYRGGLLLKAERGRMFALRRQRSPATTDLVRVEFDDIAQAELRAEVETLLDWLASGLAAEDFDLRGQVPEEPSMVPQFLEWLRAVPRPIVFAETPRVA